MDKQTRDELLSLIRGIREDMALLEDSMSKRDTLPSRIWIGDIYILLSQEDGNNVTLDIFDSADTETSQATASLKINVRDGSTVVKYIKGE